MSFLVKNGIVGPGNALQKLLGAKGEVVATVICGDNYFAENAERAAKEGLELVRSFAPDLFFAGPAFEAGRYGIACGALCQMVVEQLGIPGITGMYVENPGVELYRRYTYICKTERSAARMAESLTKMVQLGLKLATNEVSLRVVSGENIGRPEEDGYFPRGVIKNEFVEKTAAERGIEMLLAKLKGKPFQTEVQIPEAKEICIPPLIGKDLNSCEIALVTDGGVVPQGNPDGFKTRVNSAWGTYDLDRILPQDGSTNKFEIFHTGYSNVYVKENPNRLVPVDVLRDLEKERIIGKLHPTLYSTTGNAGSEVRMSEIGGLIAGELKKKGIDAAILTSTWGSSTRSGATIGAAIEKAGIPVINITAVPQVSKMMGVSKILKGETIPNPLGNIKLTREQEKALRKKYILRALEIIKAPTKEQKVYDLEGTE